jgi:hypothetical protein
VILGEALEPIERDPGRARLPLDEIQIGEFTIRPVDERHVKALAEVIHLLPPILVHRQTLALIDGLHRITVFRRAARKTIPVTWFEGTNEEALIMAVRVNTAHGRPLSLSKRQRAASQLLRQSPDRSDRFIGEVCGLDHKTIAAIRARNGDTMTGRRIGRDGKAQTVAKRAGTGNRVRRPSVTASSCADLLAYAESHRQGPFPLTELSAFPADQRTKIAVRARANELWWRSIADSVEQMSHNDHS